MPLRSTRILSIATDDPDAAILEEAAAILRDGGLVAFATETVYGLGADATNPEAVAKIFEAKGRPATNPLIVHASDLDMAWSCVRDWPEEAHTLAREFWPGPLTLVLPRSEIIPDIVTAGQDTVGVRIPLPKVAREFIARAGRPIAAPSANRSNGISPTHAFHVAKDLDGKIDLILDSGATSVGLESTVLDLTGLCPRILRPGPISLAQIQGVLKSLPVKEAGQDEPTSRPASPGQLPVHYAPRTKALWVEPDQVASMTLTGKSVLLYFGKYDPPYPRSFDHYYLMRTPAEAASSLYALLHACDAYKLNAIVIVPPPDKPEWRAIRDRLRRATTPL